MSRQLQKTMVDVSSLLGLVGCEGMNSFVSLTPASLEKLNTGLECSVFLSSTVPHETASENSMRYAGWYL